MIATNMLGLWEEYRRLIGSYDEILDDQGHPKAHWQALFQSIQQLGLTELQNRQQEIVRALRENGVSYHLYGGANGHNKPWQLDAIPLVIEQKEWDFISAGLVQRANLLNLIIKDIYGERHLVRDSIIPAELIFGNTGFYRSCFDTGLPDANHLINYSAEMARGADGRMWILDTRAQTPSGSGYALESRSVLNKVLPELTAGMHLRQLAPYFNHWQNTLWKLSQTGRVQPHIILLTPGPAHEAYFEHAYLAAYFGHTLVQGDDLVVRNGYVWLKTLEGLQKVNVIVRQVEDEWIDPLELKEDSQLGVPGLLHAVRSGKVVLANPPGVGVVENHAFLAFMPAICRYFLQEELILPSVKTWWCGQPESLAYVTEHLDNLIIKKANRKQKFQSVFGKHLSTTELSLLKEQILRNPHDFIAQEKLRIATTPSFIDGVIQPRLASIRSFVIHTDEGYRVMQGGLARIATISGQLVISNQRSGIAKDTWIVSASAEEIQDKTTFSSRSAHDTSLSSRSAENLFWVGRYSERTLSATSLLDHVLIELSIQQNGTQSLEATHLNVLLKAITHLTQTYPGFLDDKHSASGSNPFPELLDLVVNVHKSGSVASGLTSFLNAVRSIRDQWNQETWQVIDHLDESLESIQEVRKKQANPANKFKEKPVFKLLERLRTRIFMFYGLWAETMPRNAGYLLFEIGKSMEKCLSQISIMRSVLTVRQNNVVENKLLEIILVNHHLMEQYRSSYKSGLNLANLLEIMLKETTLPNSLSYQLSLLADHLDKLPRLTHEDKLNAAEEPIHSAIAQLKLADLTQFAEPGGEGYYLAHLDRLLSEIYSKITAASASLNNLYFSHTEIHQSFLQDRSDKNA